MASRPDHPAPVPTPEEMARKLRDRVRAFDEAAVAYDSSIYGRTEATLDLQAAAALTAERTRAEKAEQKYQSLLDDFSAYPVEALDALKAWEDHYGLEVVSLEHHARTVERAEKAEAVQAAHETEVAALRGELQTVERQRDDFENIAIDHMVKSRAALARADEAETDAKRYRYLRDRDLDTIDRGGVFAGTTPQNVVINGEDLDAAIDAALAEPHHPDTAQAGHGGERDGL